MKKTLRSILLPLLAAFIWGTAFVAQDIVAGRVPPMTFNAVRFFVAVLFLLAIRPVYMLIRRKRGGEEKKHKLSGSVRALIVAGVLAGTALSIASNLQQAGMEAGTDAGKSGFITAMYVVFVPIGELLLGKRLPKRFFAGLALAVIGLYLLSVKGGFSFSPGDLLTLLCAVAFAFQILLIDRFAPSLDPVLFCIAEFAVAGLLSFVGMLVFEKPDPAMIAECAVPILYVAVFSCGIAYLLQILAQREGDASIVSLLFCMESVFSVIGGAIVLHQHMTARELVGCALIFAAVVIARLPEKKPKNKNAGEDPD